MTDVSLHRERTIRRDTGTTPCEDKDRGGSHAICKPRNPRDCWQTARSRREAWDRFFISRKKEPTLSTHWPLTSRPQDCERMHFCCLSHPVCGTLLCSPREKTHLLRSISFSLGKREIQRWLIIPIQPRGSECLGKNFFKNRKRDNKN